MYVAKVVNSEITIHNGVSQGSWALHLPARLPNPHFHRSTGAYDLGVWRPTEAEILS